MLPPQKTKNRLPNLSSRKECCLRRSVNRQVLKQAIVFLPRECLFPREQSALDRFWWLDVEPRQFYMQFSLTAGVTFTTRKGVVRRQLGKAGVVDIDCQITKPKRCVIHFGWAEFMEQG